MTGWSVMLRGIRYRSGRSLVVLFLAAFATLAAVLAPAYGRAAAQSVLTDAVRSAPPSATSLTISAESSAAGADAGSYDPAQHPVSEAKTLVDNALLQGTQPGRGDRPADHGGRDRVAGRPGQRRAPHRFAGLALGRLRPGEAGRRGVRGRRRAGDGQRALRRRDQAQGRRLHHRPLAQRRRQPVAACRSSVSTRQRIPPPSTGATARISRTRRVRGSTPSSPAPRTTCACRGRPGSRPS